MEHLNYSDEWFIWEQNASPMLLTMALTSGFNGLRSYLGSCLFNSLIIFEYDDKNNYQGRWFYRPDEERILGQKMLDMLLCPPYLSSFNTGIQVAEELLLNKAKDIWGSFKHFTLDEALNNFEEFLQRYYDYYKRGWFSEPVQYHIEHLISGYLSRNYKGSIPLTEATQALFTTEEESFTVAIIKNLFECSKVVDNLLVSDKTFRELVIATNKNIGSQNHIVDYVFLSGNCKFDLLIKKLQKHSDEFHWKNNNYFAASFVSPENIFLDMIDESHISSDGISQYYSDLLTVITESKTNHLNIKSQILLELPSYYRKLIDISNSIGSKMKDSRKRNIMESNSVFDALLRIVSKETGVSLEDIHMLIPQELRSFIEDPISYQERFVERRKLFVCIQTDFPLIDELINDVDTSAKERVLSWNIHPMDELYIAEGIVAENVLNRLNMIMNFYDCSEEPKNGLHGIITFCNASDDIIEGVVRILRSPQNEYFLGGEILVAPTTTPDYIEAIYKCKAIITDWGSHTSHAAIISRELKKPCIIGTSFATHVLKTGQKIRMDFNCGSIVIID